MCVFGERVRDVGMLLVLAHLEDGSLRGSKLWREGEMDARTEGPKENSSAYLIKWRSPCSHLNHSAA